MIKLYENIRNLRIENKWTQEELAKKMGYTDRSMIAKIEAGKVDLSQSKILEFAKIFNVDPGDLMGWEDPAFLVQLSSGETALLEVYRKDRNFHDMVDRLLAYSDLLKEKKDNA